jgi:hypothetical protein
VSEEHRRQLAEDIILAGQARLARDYYWDGRKFCAFTPGTTPREQAADEITRRAMAVLTPELPTTQPGPA